MKVVILNDYGHVQGGSAQVAIETALALAGGGIDTTYFCGTPPLDERLEASGVRTLCADQPDLLGRPPGSSALHGLANRAVAKAFSALLDELDPGDTVIHCHGWTKSLSPLVFSPAIERKFRILVTAHEYFLTCPNGGFFIFPRASYCRHRPLSLDCLITDCDPRRYAHKLWRFARATYQNRILALPAGICGIIAVSRLCLDTLREHGGLPDVPTRIILNPVHVDRQTPVAPPANAPFAYVGRFSPEKGVRSLIADAGRLSRHPFLFIGEGELRDELQRAFPNAEFTGWLPKGRVLERLRASRALVFPSIWNETFGLVVAEALALGVPVICSAHSGAAELIVHGRNGWIFDARASGALASLLDELRGSPALDEARAIAHEMYWENPLSASRYLDELTTFYREVLAS